MPVLLLVLLGLVGGIALIALLAILNSLYIVRQSESIVIERLGKYKKILGPGLHLIVPLIDSPRYAYWSYFYDGPRGLRTRTIRAMYRIDLRETVYDFPKQNVITKDNVMIEIDALIYFQIIDPRAAMYEFDDLPSGIEKLTQTTLRNIVGSMDLDATLVSRDSVNQKLRIILDEASHKWGVKVNRVELQEVNPPADIRVAMEKQMRAERDRRAIILEAEGLKQSAILTSEGERESLVLRAKGAAESRVINATAEAEARLRVATAEAESLERVAKALTTTGDPAQYMIAMAYIKTFSEMVSGKDNKMVVVPYEASSMMGSLGGIKQLFKYVDQK
jgi:regulator of protease activity HflC (stomatin/prohibitin superfamily)